MMESHIAPSGAGRDVERFDQWAERYDGSILQSFFFVPVHRKMLDLLVERTSPEHPPRRILDVGCGTGRLLRAASERWPEAELIGADPASGMVAETRRLSPAVSVELATAESLPFGDESVDIVTSSLSFHHWGDQLKGIREIARVLRSGGLFCLADHTFLPSRLSGERTQSGRGVRRLMGVAGFIVEYQRWARLPFVLVSLARRP